MRHSKRRRGGFSLVELIVVIAIIAVLIGILIPTIAGVKKAARAADTRNQISRIAAACERYRGDFNAYPGPFSNTQVAPGTVALSIGPTIGATPSIALTGAAGVTSTENMIVALLGGIRVTDSSPPGTISAFAYLPDQLGKGPQNLNPMNPKIYPSYLEAGEDELKDVTGLQYKTSAGTTIAFGGSVIPEMIDRFQNEDAPRPILYLRAKVGAPGVCDITANVNVNQYNPHHLAAYGVVGFAEAADAANDTTGFPGSYNFFRSASSPAAPQDVPNQKDGFMLISAGKDGVYGTGDDILSYSR